MAHEIETMFSAGRVPTWHGLGQVIEEAPTSDLAIQYAGLDWEVESTGLFTPRGTFIKDYRANIRADNGEVLGVVSNSYQIVQNREAFEFTDSLISDGIVKYETGGSLRGGKQIWMLARMEKQYSILGDDFTPYMVFTNSHDGSGSVRVAFTPIRVVCMNTLNLALSQAERMWSTKHTGNMKDKLKEAERMLKQNEKYLDGLNVEANKLVDIRLSKSMVKDLLNELFPTKITDGDIKTRNQVEKQEGLLKVFQYDDLKKFNGTAWQAINAVSDYVQHAEPSRQTSNWKESRFEKTINGGDLLDKAHKFLKAV